MRCSRCHEEAVIIQRYSGVRLCLRHALQDIESKAKREVRKQGRIAKNERIRLPLDNSAASYSVRSFLISLLKNRQDITFVTEFEEATLIIRSDTLDDLAANVLSHVISGNIPDLLSPNPVRELAPFSVIPHEEVYLYAKSHGWQEGENSTSRKEVSEDISQFLASYTVSHPSTLYALKGVHDHLSAIAQERKYNAVQ